MGVLGVEPQRGDSSTFIDPTPGYEQARPASSITRSEPTTREVSMVWTKPEFEILELCSEVTSYVYHR